jgi:hypothetical protein
VFTNHLSSPFIPLLPWKDWGNLNLGDTPNPPAGGFLHLFSPLTLTLSP